MFSIYILLWSCLQTVIVMKLKNDFTCSKCCRNIRPSKIIVLNKKLVCPYCYRTMETNKSKVEFIEKLQKALYEHNEKER